MTDPEPPDFVIPGQEKAAHACWDVEDYGKEGNGGGLGLGLRLMDMM
jgi:hypothetical protein